MPTPCEPPKVWGTTELAILLLAICRAAAFNPSRFGARVAMSRQRSLPLRTPVASMKDQVADGQLCHLCNTCQELISADVEALGEDSKSMDNGCYSSLGNWLSESSVQRVRDVLEDTRFEPRSAMGDFIVSSPLPISCTIYRSEMIELTLLHAPPGMEAIERRHYPGTVLLYSGLYGKGVLRSLVGARVMQRDLLVEPPVYDGLISQGGKNDTDDQQHQIRSLRRVGGPTRIFEGSGEHAGGAGILELAIYLPSILTQEVGACGGTGAPSSLSLPATNGSTPTGWLSKVAAWAGMDVHEEATVGLKLALIDKVGAALPASEELLISSREQSLRLSAHRTGLKDKHVRYAVAPKLGERVGGLPSELERIASRVLLSRQLPPSTMKELGLSHVKGLLLHGPPGTGKTLIARELARALNAREPVIVNGPEIMDKFVGEAERNVRDLFRSAEEEWQQRGEESELHVIVFDEFDAIAKTRGNMFGDGSGTRDSVVNQLLTKMDGVDELPNVLVVAITNRKDLIDPALLRPGRLEVHIQIDAPKTVAQRSDIMRILLTPMQECGRVQAREANLIAQSVARHTKGFTGAELAGALRAAGSLALKRYLAGMDSTIGQRLPSVRSGMNARVVADEAPELVVTEADLLAAVEDLKDSQGKGGGLRRSLRNLRRSSSRLLRFNGK